LTVSLLHPKHRTAGSYAGSILLPLLFASGSFSESQLAITFFFHPLLCVWKYKRGPISEEMAVEKGTTVAARLVTRCGSDILGQRGRGDDHGGPEGVYSTGIFS
jgi:hypothetical protein